MRTEVDAVVLGVGEAETVGAAAWNLLRIFSAWSTSTSKRKSAGLSSLGHGWPAPSKKATGCAPCWMGPW